MIYILHTHWEGAVVLETSTQLYRQSNREEIGEYIRCGEILIVKWKLWGTEMFIQASEHPDLYRPFQMTIGNCTVETKDWTESCYCTSSVLIRPNGDYARINKTYIQDVRVFFTLEWEKWPTQYVFPVNDTHYIEMDILKYDFILLKACHHPTLLFFVDASLHRISQIYHAQEWESIQWNASSIIWKDTTYIKSEENHYYIEEKMYQIKKEGKSAM
jgi:hypothetical protein